MPPDVLQHVSEGCSITARSKTRPTKYQTMETPLTSLANGSRPNGSKIAGGFVATTSSSSPLLPPSLSVPRFTHHSLTMPGLAALLFVLQFGVGPCDGFSLNSFNLGQTLAAVLDGQNTSPRQLKVLMFGGNGFLGGVTAERLVKAGHEVVTVSRGNWYWDSEFLVRPHVQQVICDRLYPLEKCEKFMDLMSNVTVFDVVIDFTAYYPDAVTSTLKVLENKAKLYIFISTDSVYDVCEKNNDHPSTETDAVRPSSEKTRQELESKESYGHHKLLIEEELAKQRAAGGIPYISLRLPDVIGPRDNTYRWWIYQVWMKLADHLDRQLAVPSYLVSKPMSLVFVADVADVIMNLLHPKPEALDQAFNLAFKETPTLLKLLTDIKTALNITDLSIVTDETDKAIHLFPSVKNGPVDISKAQDILGFSPTPLQQAVTETVDFYELAMTNPYYYVPRKEIIRNMQAHFTSRPFKVLLGLKKHYGLDFQMPKDEL